MKTTVQKAITYAAWLIGVVTPTGSGNIKDHTLDCGELSVKLCFQQKLLKEIWIRNMNQSSEKSCKIGRCEKSECVCATISRVAENQLNQLKFNYSVMLIYDSIQFFFEEGNIHESFVFTVFTKY